MPDFALYYWPLPFRGQFVRAILAFAGKTWSEADAATISALMSGQIKDMPVPFMGPPLLVDSRNETAVAQMPAIMLYLGETLHLLPADAAQQAATLKIVHDANDVIDELTLDGGRQMWTEKRWTGFQPRLRKWMSIWEETGRRHGLHANRGFILGGDAAGIADVVTATLWGTMADRFPKIADILTDAAPMTAGLVRRVANLPPLEQLAARTRRAYGDSYCGGRIEASLRKVLRS